MPLYRFEMKIIGRTAGHSATAAAAYRSAAKLHDRRTGTVHDYSNRRGVIHSEILAPENTPAWMLNREDLWNAVEAAETRKDAQLTREMLIALPHELTYEQRLELTRSFVADHFVARGMIADLNIHSPYSDDDDPRNHHAHILLTMRNLTAEGFGHKNRDWNDRALLEHFREQWAEHQNRTFQRLNLPFEVDHRSYELRGIDREPTKHMGPYACELEKNGERSRIGEENREIETRNAERADRYRQRAELDRTIRHSFRRAITVDRVADLSSPLIKRHLTRKEELWAGRAQVQREAIHDRERLAILDLDQKHHQPEMMNLRSEIRRDNHVMKATMAAEVEAIERRLQAKGVTRFFRDIFGRTRQDLDRRENFQRTIAGIESREKERLAALTSQHQREVDALKQNFERQRQHLEKVLQVQSQRRAEAVQMARGFRAMRDRSKISDSFRDRAAPEKHEGNTPPPKPTPTLQPAPPRMAGPTPMGSAPATPDAFARKVDEWAKTPEGRRATEQYERDKAALYGPTAPDPATPPQPAREWWDIGAPEAKPITPEFKREAERPWEPKKDRDRDRE